MIVYIVITGEHHAEPEILGASLIPEKAHEIMIANVKKHTGESMDYCREHKFNWRKYPYFYKQVSENLWKTKLEYTEIKVIELTE